MQQNDNNRDVCISRTSGEDFSLMIEVVKSKRVNQIFDRVPGQPDSPSWKQNGLRSSTTTNVLKYTNTDEYSESDVSHINPIDQK